MYGGEERYIQSSGGEPEGKRPLGIPYGRWQNIIKMDLKVIGLESVDWSGSGQGHVAGCCKDGRDPSGSIKWGEFLGYLTNCLFQQKVCAPWCCLVSLLAGLSGCKGLRKLFCVPQKRATVVQQCGVSALVRRSAASARLSKDVLRKDTRFLC